MKKILYHGTDSLFEDFSNEFLCTKDSLDQYGSGFYFYDTPGKTVLHGSMRVTVEVEICKSIEHTDRWCSTADDIESLILKAPDLENRLSDFGDIDWEGFDEVLSMTINSYTGRDFYTNTLNTLGNDFFDPEDTHILLNAFVKMTGINCITDSERGIYVILDKSYINIISTIHEQEWTEKIENDNRI